MGVRLHCFFISHCQLVLFDGRLRLGAPTSLSMSRQLDSASVTVGRHCAHRCRHRSEAPVRATCARLMDSTHWREDAARVRRAVRSASSLHGGLLARARVASRAYRETHLGRSIIALPLLSLCRGRTVALLLTGEL